MNSCSNLIFVLFSHLPPAALVNPVHMASLVPQGYPDGMDVMVVTEIREPRETLDQWDLQDYKDQRENLEFRVLAARTGRVERLGLPVRCLIRTGKSAHGKA